MTCMWLFCVAQWSRPIPCWKYHYQNEYMYHEGMIVWTVYKYRIDMWKLAANEVFYINGLIFSYLSASFSGIHQISVIRIDVLNYNIQSFFPYSSWTRLASLLFKKIHCCTSVLLNILNETLSTFAHYCNIVCDKDNWGFCLPCLYMWRRPRRSLDTSVPRYDHTAPPIVPLSYHTEI